MFEQPIHTNTVFWVPGVGYPPGRGERKQPFYPRWARYVGYDKGLSIEMAHIPSESQPLCTGGSSGFKVDSRIIW